MTLPSKTELIGKPIGNFIHSLGLEPTYLLTIFLLFFIPSIVRKVLQGKWGEQQLIDKVYDLSTLFVFSVCIIMSIGVLLGRIPHYSP
jgi:hypothetical protein